MKRRVRLLILPALLTLLAMVVSAPTASAAGDRAEHYQNDIFIGDPIPWHTYPDYFWTDTDGGSQSLHLSVCNGNPDITLMRYGTSGWVPALTTGATKRFWCLNTDGGWLTWNNLPPGVYHYEVTNPRNGTTELDIAYAHAAW